LVDVDRFDLELGRAQDQFRVVGRKRFAVGK
jgi:hypothetical protein